MTREVPSAGPGRTEEGPSSTGPRPVEADRHRRALAREALASALYVAPVLLAILVAVPRTRLPSDMVLVQLILSAGLGLVVAHWVAFRLAAPMTSHGGAWSVAAAQEASAALAGGVLTAVVAALPFMLLDGTAALTSSLLLLAAMPAVAAGLVARLRGGSWGRTLLSASWP